MLLLIENSTTNIISFVVVVALIIALLYSIIVLRGKNELIEKQNNQIRAKNKQLKAQNRELIKINEEKTNLISVVSHDLKSPFNRIFALLNLMKITNDDSSEEQQEYLSKMHQVIKDGMALIRNLLDLRAIEEEGIEMKPERLELIKTIKEVMKAHKPLAEIKDIKLRFSSAVSAIAVSIDKIYLSRILDNLLSNALKFSERGTEVMVKLEDVKDDLLKISVQDEGPGISVEDQQKLFQKYQVLSARPTDGESSTGLGLSIVKSLVERLGGEVMCDSSMGEGATFSVLLPKA